MITKEDRKAMSDEAWIEQFINYQPRFAIDGVVNRAIRFHIREAMQAACAHKDRQHAERIARAVEALEAAINYIVEKCIKCTRRTHVLERLAQDISALKGE